MTYQEDFSAEEFRARWNEVFDAVGSNAVVVLQGADSVKGHEVFRQYNMFYYLCGIEVPHAYLLLNGRSRKTTLFLPQLSEKVQRSLGNYLSPSDADFCKELAVCGCSNTS